MDEYEAFNDWYANNKDRFRGLDKKEIARFAFIEGMNFQHSINEILDKEPSKKLTGTVTLFQETTGYGELLCEANMKKYTFLGEKTGECFGSLEKGTMVSFEESDDFTSGNQIAKNIKVIW